MVKYNLSDFFRGWIIGNFSPSLVKTDKFEVGILKHIKGEIWSSHYHKIATEYNVLINGHMLLNENEIFPNDVFVLNPGEIANPTFLEDCTILVVKIPSLPNDKYEV
jgi:predicted phosphodiesterase